MFKRNCFYWLFFFVFGLVVISCATKQEKFINNFADFVSDLEISVNDLTQEDWEYLDDEFDGFFEEYKEMSNSFTKEQQKEIGRLFAKYTRLRILAIGEALDNYSGLVDGYLGELFGDSPDHDLESNDVEDGNIKNQPTAYNTEEGANSNNSPDWQEWEEDPAENFDEYVNSIPTY